MTNKLERRFKTWDEFQQELETNLKNFGLFIPGEIQIELRKKIEVELWLPSAQNPIMAKAEVVAIFPGGVALHLEENPEWLKQIQTIANATIETQTGKEDKEPEPPWESEEIKDQDEKEIPEQTLQKEYEEISEEEKKEVELAESVDASEEEVEKIEKKLSSAGMDMSNLYQAIRRLTKIEKIQLAKRGNRKALSILIQSGDRMLFRFIIQNPHMTVAEVLQLFKHPMITTEIITELARNPAWAQNEEVKYQIVIHPKTPLPTALTLLNGLNQRQLGAIAKSQHIRTQLKSNALKLLLKRQSGTF